MSRAEGFTVVELLVTLFITVAFLAIGHQLYATIMTKSGEAQQRAKASNLAYQYLRTKSDSTTSPCVPGVNPNNQTVTSPPEGLSQVRVTVTTTCPNSALPQLSKIVATVTYGSDAREVTHALFSNGK